MSFLYGVFAALASELTFVIGFIVIYLVVRLLHFLYHIIHLRSGLMWMLDGIFCGTGCVFLACYVTYLITKNEHFSGLAIILISLFLPLIGEYSYYRYLSKSIRTNYIGRLHLAMKSPAQRGQFEFNVANRTQILIIENRREELEDEKQLHLMKQQAYNDTQVYLTHIFSWSLIGYVIGIIAFSQIIM